jgi:bacteriorhodopsin
MKTTTTTYPGPVPTVIPSPTEYEVAGESGFRTLWVVFAIMTISSAIFAGISWNIALSRRLCHTITTLVTIIAAISYFAMASGHSTTFHCIKVRDHHRGVSNTYHDECRQIYWARYVDWGLTTPLILLELCLLAGIDGAHTLMAIAADLIMVLAGLFGAFGHNGTAQKWGWYAIAWVAYLVVIWHVALHGSRGVSAKGAPVAKLFRSLALFILLLWAAYPIFWGIADVARKINVDSEILAYAVLDILAKVVFGLWLLISFHRVPDANFDIGGYWDHGLGTEGRIRIGDNERA